MQLIAQTITHINDSRLLVCVFLDCFNYISVCVFPQSMDSSDLSDGPITLQEYLEVKKALASSEAKVQQLMKVNNNLSEELRRLQKEVRRGRILKKCEGGMMAGRGWRYGREEWIEWRGRELGRVEGRMHDRKMGGISICLPVDVL